jgi:DNA-binding transcriptional LysR family regulator
MRYIVSMHKVNSKNFDFNLLIALKVLLEERHVSRAAARVYLSQPAMSRALGRLRAIFNDPLLVKSQQGLVLTERASQLLLPLQSILSDVETLVKSPETNPGDMQGEIRIATRDNETAVILPAIIKQVAAHAPLLRLNIVPLRGDDYGPLDQHSVDFILSGTRPTSGTLHQLKVLDEGFVCLVDKNSQAANQPLTLDHYLQMRHCLVSITNVGAGLVDKLLAEKNLKREVAIKIPYFSSVPHIIQDSDLIITLPARLGRLLAMHYPLICLEPPIPIPNYQIHLYWHPKQHMNPIHQWIRKLFQQYAKN